TGWRGSIPAAEPRGAVAAAAPKRLRPGLTDRQRARRAPARLRRGRDAELLGQLGATALRAAGDVARRADQGLGLMGARRTAVFIDRHRSSYPLGTPAWGRERDAPPSHCVRRVGGTGRPFGSWGLTRFRMLNGPIADDQGPTADGQPGA